MKDSGDKLSDEDKATVENAVKEAKVELESNDNDRIVKATEKLSNDVQAVFSKLYQQAQQAGGAGAPEGEGDTEFHQ
jgi:molecular chaperone DnaK